VVVDDGLLRAPDVHEDVLERLGPDILWGDLSTVDDLRLELIEDRYGVSRTAAREVVRVLEAMGVVTSRRRVGITVRPRQEWKRARPPAHPLAARGSRTGRPVAFAVSYAPRWSL
jgi:DNA-binding FadR family transcriptional regulator